MLITKTQKLNVDAIIPTYGSADAAGADLYSLEKIEIVPGTNVKVHTGIAMEIPSGYVGLVYARSGLATKRGLRPANAVGVIDSDYRGEIIVALYNDSNETQIIESSERIAQIVITPYQHAAFVVTDLLDKTTRGDGGFGSTGTK